MSLAIRRISGAVAAVLIAGTAGLATGVAHATTTPPWEPDANSVGGLLFFDSSGSQVTGGNINDPVAAYIEGSATINSGDTKATLFGYTPKDGQAPGLWSGDQLTGSTVYPNASAPSAVSQTLPVVTGNPGTDETVADLISDFPNTDSSSDGYAGLYQLRLKTAELGHIANTTYDSADILVTGSGASATWSVVYSQTALPTTTTLAVSPAASARHGGSVTLTASVSPSAATGSVKFLDGTTVLGTRAVSGGSASLTTTSLSNGKHKLSATFVPTGSDYVTSTSATHTLTVTAAPTSVTVKASASSVKKGKKLTLTAVEKPSVAGKVTFLDGSKKLAAVAVKGGKATYSTTKLKVGKHTIKATFTPSNTTNSAASTSKAIKVTVKK